MKIIQVEAMPDHEYLFGKTDSKNGFHFIAQELKNYTFKVLEKKVSFSKEPASIAVDANEGKSECQLCERGGCATSFSFTLQKACYASLSAM